jgi:hypothetical protein
MPMRFDHRQDAAGVPPCDFRTAVFPERAFPVAPEREAEYLAGCRRGYATMARSRVAITGLARDIGGVLPLTIRRLEDVARCFADYRIFVYENDSIDDTRHILERWARDDRRVDIFGEPHGEPVNPSTRCLRRAQRMARYRSRCQQAVLAAGGQFDAAIVVDLDLIGGWSTDGIANSFGHRGWDFLGSNGLIYRRHGLRMNEPRQYDTWALRLDADLTPMAPADAGGMLYRRGDPLVPVTSCFGGLGIYTMDAYRTGTYGNDDLEHASFHRSLLSRGHARLFLNPSQIVVYGRRHRFGDATADAINRVWSAMTGRRVPPCLFRASAAPPPQQPLPRRAAA